jgi:NhaP-type Na+/H+ or K+/H+ antiporter
LEPYIFSLEPYLHKAHDILNFNYFLYFGSNNSSRPKFLTGNSWRFLFLLYVYIQLSRVVVVGVLYPLLCRFGYGLDWKESIILVWSGLRGAVALALSLSVKQSSGNSHISKETGTLFLFFTGGIVFLTLIVNGSTTQFVLRLLRMDILPAPKVKNFSHTNNFPSFK